MNRRPLAAYAFGVTICFLIAATAFVVHRNREHRRVELERARVAAAAVARGEQPLARVVTLGIVAPAAPSAKYPFLRLRALAGPAARPLGGPDATPEDKLLADAATEAERGGPFARILADGSDRIVATAPAPTGTAVVVALPLEGPAPFPFLVFFGLIAAGAAIVVATRRIGGEGATLGLAVSTACLAPPAAVWGGMAAVIPILVVALAVAIADARGKVDAALAALRRHRVAYAYLVPAAVGMAVLVLAPFLVGTTLGFYDHARGDWRYVGLDNFARILGGDGRSFTDPLNFWFTLGVTVAWTALNVALHVTIGVALALALRERWMKARGLWRVLLILPWAVPNYITALIWRGMFQKQFGAVNSLLDSAGVGGVSWFSEFSTAFAANVVTNTWLGFPFMMVVALGALESIPRELYEAASVDGAGAWKRFVHITLPNLRPALMPAVVLGSVWTFNMFNVIYLVSGGKPAGSTDILVTQAYRWAFERGQRYGMAAAYATIIFLILVAWTLLAHRLGRGEKEETT